MAAERRERRGFRARSTTLIERKRGDHRALRIERMESRQLLAADLLIGEFMASNSDGLRDADGEASDWLEIYNAGSEAVDLAGWHLTDETDNLDRWTFPSTLLDPGGRLIVFASGKDRAVSGGELHTDFRIDADGDFLALVAPDDTTVVHAYGPQFPRQLSDISYGLPQQVTSTTLIKQGAASSVLVPADGALGTSWTSPDFVPTGWTNGTTGVGYDTAGNYAGLIGTNVGAQMQGQNASAYARIPFEVLSPEDQQLLTLRMKYDDGFVAYLNGQEVARRNAPDDLAWNSASSAEHGGALGGVNYANFSGATGLSLLGNASLTAGRARLTAAAGNQRGAVWATDPIPFDGSFTFSTNFAFEISAAGGSSDGLDGAGGEGFVFALQTRGNQALGDAGGNMGFLGSGGPSQYVTVEFDTRPTGAWDGSRSTGNHIAVNTHQQVVSINGGNSVPRFNDGGVRYAWIDYDGATHEIKVYYATNPAKPATPTVARTVDLSALFGGATGLYAGFTASTGPGTNVHDIVTWNLTTGTAELGNVPEEINLSGYTGLLREGANVLAIHGLNVAADDADFVLSPELVATTVDQDPSAAKHYFRAPTPGQLNGVGFLGFVGDTRFSQDRGFYDEPFDLTITTDTPGAEIRYTLNGSLPTSTSGTLYAVPIHVSGTTTLRAIAYKAGFDSSNVDTQTYVFIEDIVRQNFQATRDRGFPASWGGFPADYGMDPDVIGQTGPDLFGGVYAATIRDDLRALPSVSIVANIDDLFGSNGIYTNSTAEGAPWERSASIEMIDPTGAEEFQIDAGLRIHGGAFRNHSLTPKHSFRALFKEEYGAAKFHFPLFGGDAVDEFDTFVLRANANDGWQWDGAGAHPQYARDEFLRRVQLAMGQPSGHGRHVHLYINGAYWGLYNLIERPDESFMESYIGGDKSEWDVINTGEAINGSLTAWNTLVSMANQVASASTETQRTALYQRILGNNPDGTRNPDYEIYLDVDNMIDYMIANLYGGNRDWPHNNFYMARRRGPESTGFKFFNWDAEWIMNLQSGLNENLISASAGVAQPYNALRASAEFRLRVADRLQKHFSKGGALYVNPSSPAWNPDHPENNAPAATYMSVIAEIDRAIVAESARWGDQHRSLPYTRNAEWVSELTFLTNTYLPQRSAIVLSQFRAASMYSDVIAPRFSQPGGHVPYGYRVGLIGAEPIYFTTDGSDPRLPGGGLNPVAQLAELGSRRTLLAGGASASVLVPTQANGGATLGQTWTQLEFDDASWTAGTTGIGFDRGTGYESLIGVDIESQMYNVSGSAFIRVPFEVDDPLSLAGLTLKMKYDDGFIAYLNGVEVARRNSPQRVTAASPAATDRPDSLALLFENIDLSDSLSVLRAGANVLAIQGMNSSFTNDDFLIVPEIEGISNDSGTPLFESAVVKARARTAAGNWSPLSEAEFIVDARPNLRISELMYHPADPPPGSPYTDNDFEFVELTNIGTHDVSLAGIRFADGIEFDFSTSDIANLAPGQYAVIVNHREAFLSRYGDGVTILGEYLGNLNNAGEHLRIEDATGAAILDFTYSDEWRPSTDGDGPSLVVVDLLADPDDWGNAQQWRASLSDMGSPGRGERAIGDTNGDGLVDLADLNNVRNHFGEPAPGSLGDADGDGDADLADLNAVRNSFGGAGSGLREARAAHSVAVGGALITSSTASARATQSSRERMDAVDRLHEHGALLWLRSAREGELTPRMKSRRVLGPASAPPR